MSGMRLGFTAAPAVLPYGVQSYFRYVLAEPKRFLLSLLAAVVALFAWSCVQSEETPVARMDLATLEPPTSALRSMPTVRQDPTPVPLVIQPMVSPSSDSVRVQQWERTGYWYREDDQGRFFLPDGAGAAGGKVAVLDALPGDEADLYIALSCWDGAKAVVQVAPYSLDIPAGVDHAMLLIWDHGSGKEIAKFTTKLGSSLSLTIARASISLIR